MDNNGNYSQHWNERSAIHYRMNQLQGEMRAVRDEYERLFDRLRDLDRIESQQKQQSYFNSYTQTSSPPLHSESESKPLNVQEEFIEKQEDDVKIEKKPEEVQEIKELIEELPKKSRDSFMNPDVINEVLEGLKKSKESTKDKDNKQTSKKENTSKTTKNKKSTKKENTKNTNTMTKREEIKARKELVIRTLQENDRMRARDISSLLEGKGLKVNNITSFLTELAKEVAELQRVDRGVYAWIEPVPSDPNQEIENSEEIDNVETEEDQVADLTEDTNDKESEK